MKITELPEIIEASTETFRKHIGDMLRVKCNHPKHGELIWIQGGGEPILMIQP